MENPELQFVSPVSGTVVAVNRGERRRVLSVVVESDGKKVTHYRKGKYSQQSYCTL